MGKGLSQLQRAILEALEGFPKSKGESPYIGDWARPRDIMQALGRTNTNANRAAISKTLARLCERGLVDMAFPGLVAQGHGARYALPHGTAASKR